MARKTKAELEAEAKVARALAEKMARDEYPARLMAALEEATTKSNYELTVRDGMFQVSDRDNRRNDTTPLSATWTETSQSFLESLEWDLQAKAEERAEAERLSNLRRQAFLKLTKEEQEALGLNDRNNW